MSIKSPEVFETHIQQSLAKLENLWQRSNAIPTADSESWQNARDLQQQQQLLLRESLEELADSIEELKVASETLRQQNNELLASRQEIEAQKQYYHELFDSAPDCYIVTTKEGTIKEVNQKTTELLAVSAQYLSRKSLAVFIGVDSRQKYYTKLNQLKRGQISEATWTLEINPRQQQAITVQFTVIAKRDRLGKIINLRWRISPVQTTLNQENNANLTPILLNGIRYPLYNLIAQIEEIKSENKFAQLVGNRRLASISREISNLKHLVNNVYIINFIKTTADLNPSLVDYSIFLAHVVKQIKHRHNLPQKITLDLQPSCVGICDLLLLEQIVINILDISIECTLDNNQIEIKLNKDLSTNLNVKINSLVSKTNTENLLTIFQLLTSKNKLEIQCDRDLNLAVVQQCLNLLEGEIKLNSPDNNCVNLTITIPSISVTSNK